METEEQVTLHHEELIEASNAGESAKLMELSKLVAEEEAKVEEMFEELETAQTQLDEINEKYDKKIEDLG